MELIRLIYTGLLALLMLQVLPSGSLSSENPVAVNLMLDVNTYPSIGSEQNSSIHDSFFNLAYAVDKRGLRATLYPTGRLIESERLLVTNLGNRSNWELAMGGVTGDENLSSMSYSGQKSLLDKNKQYIEACHICGVSIVSPKGFKPQSFDQNENTYQILDQMGAAYDAGFKAGALYLPGHEKDVWPYQIPNHRLYAVPISTYNVSGQQIYMSDSYAKENKLDSSMWYAALTGKFDEAARNSEPMVVIFDNLISGSGDYLDAYQKFLDYAISKNAKFMTTLDLINATKAGGLAEGAVEVKPENTPGCVICDTLQSLNNTSINITANNTTANNESAPTIISLDQPIDFIDKPK